MRYIETLSLDGIESYLLDLARQHPNIVDVQVAGRSVEGRPIYLVIVTDPGQPLADKQVPLIASTLHGNEKLGTAVMLKLLAWLVSEEARSIREQQSVMIFPCVNVDGYQAVSSLNANGVDLKEDFAELTQPESRIVWEVVKAHTPDIVVDLHGNTGDLDFWCPQNLAACPINGMEWDRDVLAKMANLIDQASADAGYPPDMAGGISEVFPLPQRAYDEFHSLCLVVHAMPRPQEDLWDVRFKKLLEIGNNRWPTEHYPGYPNSTVIHIPWSNSFLTNCGDTAEERRKSRVELWRARDQLTLMEGNPSEWGKIITFARAAEHSSTMRIKHGAGLRFRMPQGATVTGLQINGKEQPAEDYAVWEGSHHTWLQSYVRTTPVERHPDCRFAAAAAVLTFDTQ
jgi:hypothetical protein